VTHDNIMSVLEDQAANLWIGTWGGGLNQMTAGKVEAHTTRNGFFHDRVLSICESRDGSIWAGADYDGGLAQLKAGTLTRYTWRDGLLNAAVRVLHEDGAGNLWVGTSKGLSCLRGGWFTQNVLQQHLAGRIVRAICEDHEGGLWFGTEQGLCYWKDEQFTDFTVRDGLSSSAILALYEDAEHDLWIGTVGGGLNRRHQGTFSSYTTKQGLYNDDVLAILEDNYGYFWMSCLEGLSRVRKAELAALDEKKIEAVHAVSYGRVDGFISAQFNGVAQPAAWKGRDGRLWFPTTKGLLAVEPGVPVNEAPPPVVIEQVIMDKRQIRLPAARQTAGDAAGASLALEAGDAPIRVRRDRGELEFHFTALSYQLPEKNRFKYKLEGVDQEWNDAGPQHAANYHGLAPGQYRFLVMACNNDGVWNETPASLDLELLPHFWQTPWFRTLAVVALGGSLAGLVRHLSIKRWKRKLASMERERAIERERARIAKDIHDDLGSSLTRIAMMSELVEADKADPGQVQTHARKIAASARATVQSLDEIVWAVSPENDTWNSLAEYLSRYASEFFQGTNVRCRLEMALDLPACPLSSEVRHNLFLVIKEALNNILKHAGASYAHLRVSANTAGVELVITDDGRGFDLEAPSSGPQRNGLINMRQRLAALGGNCRIESRPGQGTKLTLTLPLNAPPPSHVCAMQSPARPG
jgi:signal transduction histidine kinase